MTKAVCTALAGLLLSLVWSAAPAEEMTYGQGGDALISRPFCAS